MAEDLYQTLGVGRDATKDEIQKAYRKLARKHHPDLNQNDKQAQEKFKRVQEAYDVLSDDEKRAAYNRYGADFERIRGSGYRPGASGGPAFEGLDLEQIFGGAGAGGRGGFENGFSDFFEQLMGGRGGGTRAGGGRRAAATPGANLRHQLQIPLSKAITGGPTEFYIHGPAGANLLSINVPPGVESGFKMRLRGKGAPSSNGGPPGDLIVVIEVLDDPTVRRVGRNLEMTLPVSLREAALGAKIDVKTPRSSLTLSIPPCSSSGRKLRIKGQGMTGADGVSGDLIVQIQIVLPKTLDDEAKQAIIAIDERHPYQPRS